MAINDHATETTSLDVLVMEVEMELELVEDTERVT